jgi:hypothetical protein
MVEYLTSTFDIHYSIFDIRFFMPSFNPPVNLPNLNLEPCLPCEARRAKKGTRNLPYTKNSSTTIASRI